MSDDPIKKTPAFNGGSDPISRWLDRGKAKGHRVTADVLRARAEEARAYDGFLDASIEVSRKLNHLKNILPDELDAAVVHGRAESYMIKQDAKHAITMREMQHALELEQHAQQLEELRSLPARKAAGAIAPPPAAVAAPASPPPPPAPPATAAAPPPEGLAIRDIVNLMARLPEMTPQTRATFEDLLRKLEREKRG